MAVVSDQAAAIGVTAVPTPVTDYGSDRWFVIEQMQSRLRFSDQTAIYEAGHERMVDSKAQRKVDISEDIVVIVETSAFQSSVELFQALRVLVKLH